MFNLLEHVMPDMILLDVEMPQMDGYEAARKLKCSEVYREIPIIFLTARNDMASETEGLNLGAVDYIHKPFTGGLLLRHMEMYLSLTNYRKILEERDKTIEELTREKSEFFSRLSQIRSPMNAIVEMLGIALSTDDPEKIKNCLSKANSASTQLLSVINELCEKI
jgi:CheY-like chemotaxis protein